MVGKRNGHEAVIFSLLEKKTENYIAIRISGKTSEGVMEAMQMLREEYGGSLQPGVQDHYGGQWLRICRFFASRGLGNQSVFCPSVQFLGAVAK